MLVEIAAEHGRDLGLAERLLLQRVVVPQARVGTLGDGGETEREYAGHE